MIGENIHLKLHLDPDLGLVKLDPTQAQQILLNLVLNARDALPEGGHITIETGSHVQILSDIDGLNIPNPMPSSATVKSAQDNVRQKRFEP
jgi:signal transduction histidine kinase